MDQMSAAHGIAEATAEAEDHNEPLIGTKDKLEELGNDTTVSTPAEFRARVEADMNRWRPLAHVVNQS